MLARLEDIALSNKDILELLNRQCSIILYPDLHKYKTIDDVLGPHEACIILFESKPKYGHWCAVWKLDKNTCSFFNPYGGYPDDSLIYIDDWFRRKSNQQFPYLSQLLLDSPYDLTYNEYQYQARASNIKTCGRHCVVRLFNRSLTDSQYHNYINRNIKKHNATADQIVTLLTPIKKSHV